MYHQPKMTSRCRGYHKQCWHKLPYNYSVITHAAQVSYRSGEVLSWPVCLTALIMKPSWIFVIKTKHRPDVNFTESSLHIFMHCEYGTEPWPYHINALCSHWWSLFYKLCQIVLGRWWALRLISIIHQCICLYYVGMGPGRNINAVLVIQR